jgi:hypothetical protein
VITERERELLDICERLARAERECIAAQSAYEQASQDLNASIRVVRVPGAPCKRVPTEDAFRIARAADERYDLARDTRDAELDELKHTACVWLAERDANAGAGS